MREEEGPTRACCLTKVCNTSALTTGYDLQSVRYHHTRLIALIVTNGSHDTSDTDSLDVDGDRISWT